VEFGRYFRHVLPTSPVGDGDDVASILDHCDHSGFAIIGTPDDAMPYAASMDVVEQARSLRGNVADHGTWNEKFARKIDQLPILNVDKDKEISRSPPSCRPN
jgi:hypothetical protein